MSCAAAVGPAIAHNEDWLTLPLPVFLRESSLSNESSCARRPNAVSAREPVIAI
jgi:hypothetical protein